MTSFLDPDDVQNFRVETAKSANIARVILQGEADISTLRDLEAALEDFELDGAKAVHLHLGELDFADTATIRRLTVFARQAKQTGLDVKTWGANPTLHKLAIMLEAQDDLGLT
jgi:anti-anti-sigma regulatory factor